MAQLSKEDIQQIVQETIAGMDVRVYQNMIPPGQIKQRHILEGYIIFSGLAADRPTNSASLVNPINAWFATDTGVLSVWNGASWTSAASYLNSSSVATSGAGVQAGWGYMQGAASQLVTTVTFPQAFSSLPIVTATWGGDNAASGAYGAGGNNVKGLATCKAEAITATTFDVRIRTTDGTSWGAGDFVFYQWVAVGTLA